MQCSHYIVFVTFLKENKYEILLCIVVIFQGDINMLRDFPAHNSSNLVVTVKKPQTWGNVRLHELLESRRCAGT